MAVLWKPEVAVGDTVTELGSLFSIGMVGSQSSRDQRAALIIRGKIALITHNEQQCQNLEDSMEMENGAQCSLGQ